MGKNIHKNISKNFSSKNGQKLFDHAKSSTTDPIRTASKKAIQKAAEATGDLIGNKIADKIMKVSKNLQQNNSETAVHEHNQKIPKKRQESPEKRKEIIHDLRLKEPYNNGISKNHKVANSLQKNNSETVTNGKDKETLKETYIPPNERLTLVDNLDINIIV